MRQESQQPSPKLQDVHVQLSAISDLLRHPHRMDTAAQTALADLVEELDNALKIGEIPQDEAARLATTALHFTEAIHREEEPGALKEARQRLDEAAMAAENHAPMVAGLAMRFMDALSNIGI
jgi:hypothetical protein